MKRVWLLLSFACCGACRSAEVAPKPTPMTAALLAAAQAWGDDSKGDDAAFTRAELDRIASEVRSALASDPRGSRRAALNQTLFGKLGFVREVTDQDLGFVFLPQVLKQRRGSCVGLGSLYLALGERLGWRIRGVMVPGHFFVRVEERGTLHNLELLRGGEEMPDDWYKQRFPIPGGAAREYGRALTPDEVLGVIEYDVGNERRRQQRFAEAGRAYQRARDHFPEFAEAHASLGALAQLLGSLDEARADYEAARRANPNLPGLDRNLSLLESERKAQTPE